jgi:O-antigen/teichoic acid export membrane protein
LPRWGSISPGRGRRIPPADVGIAAGAVSAVTLCAQVALVGVGSAVITLLPRHMPAPSRLLDTSASMLVLTSLAAGLAFLLFAGTVLEELAVVAADPAYAALFLVLAVSGTLGVLFDQVSTARRRGDQALLRGLAAGVVTLAAVTALGWAAAGPEASLGIFLAWVLGGVTTVVLGLWTMTRAVPGYRPRPRLDRPVAGELVRVGLPNYALTLAERAPGFVLPIVVLELLSPADNAAWYAAWMMSWVVFVVPIQVGMTSFAEIARRPGETRQIVRHGIATSLALGVAGALVLAVIAEPVLGLLGPEYAATGALPLRILLLGIVPMTLIQAYFSLCRARRVLGPAIAIGVASSIASIVLPAMAGVAAGLPATALAWLAVQGVTAVVATVLLRRGMSGPGQAAG